jgi:hypothetical protein
MSRRALFSPSKMRVRIAAFSFVSRFQDARGRRRG